MTIHVNGPFGGCDEQAETENFEHLVGGPNKGFKLLRILQDSNNIDIFKKRAKREGFTDEQITALLHLQ